MAAPVDLRARLPRDLTWLAGLTLAFASARFVAGNRLGVDAHAYWAASSGALYDGAPDTLDAYLYSPAFAQLVWLPARLPWPVFGVLWSLAAVAAFVWLLRPLGWGWTVPLLLCCAPEILTGNVFWALALVAAYGVRPTGAWPALWAFPLLTKVTPGLGPLWFLARGEWRAVATSLGATALVVAVSAALAPGDWLDWWHFLVDSLRSSGGTVGSPLAPPLWVRLPAALLLVVWAARTDRRWGLPLAMALATPVAGIAALTILTSVPRLIAPADAPESGGGARRRA